MKQHILKVIRAFLNLEESEQCEVSVSDQYSVKFESCYLTHQFVLNLNNRHEYIKIKKIWNIQTSFLREFPFQIYITSSKLSKSTFGLGIVEAICFLDRERKFKPFWTVEILELLNECYLGLL